MEMGNFRLKLKSQDFFNNIKMNTSWQDQERKHINIFINILYLYLCKVFCTKLHTTQYFFNIQATVLTYVYRYARRIYHILRIKKKCTRILYRESVLKNIEGIFYVYYMIREIDIIVSVIVFFLESMVIRIGIIMRVN